MTPIIDINHISKTYHQRRAADVVALKDVSLTINEGAFFGLIGPNGAGKSTLIKILTGLCIADSGHVCVDGHDVIKQYQAARQLIGVSLQEHAFDPYLLVEEELYISGGYYGKSNNYLKKRVPELLEQFNLVSNCIS